MPAIAVAETVGSLLRPAYLREARQGRRTGGVSDAELRAAEDRWVAREQERAAVTEALWSARLAASEIQWQSEESERFSRAFAHQRTKLGLERWRRAACWVALAIAIGSMLVA